MSPTSTKHDHAHLLLGKLLTGATLSIVRFFPLARIHHALPVFFLHRYAFACFAIRPHPPNVLQQQHTAAGRSSSQQQHQQQQQPEAAQQPTTMVWRPIMQRFGHVAHSWPWNARWQIGVEHHRQAKDGFAADAYWRGFQCILDVWIFHQLDEAQWNQVFCQIDERVIESVKATRVCIKKMGGQNGCMPTSQQMIQQVW